MSATLHMPIRDRWRAREVTVQRWHRHAGDKLAYGDPVVDLAIDGRVNTINYTEQNGRDPDVSIRWLYHKTGDESGP